MARSRMVKLGSCVKAWGVPFCRSHLAFLTRTLSETDSMTPVTLSMSFACLSGPLKPMIWFSVKWHKVRWRMCVMSNLLFTNMYRDCWLIKEEESVAFYICIPVQSLSWTFVLCCERHYHIFDKILLVNSRSIRVFVWGSFNSLLLPNISSSNIMENQPEWKIEFSSKLSRPEGIARLHEWLLHKLLVQRRQGKAAQCVMAEDSFPWMQREKFNTGTILRTM